MSKEELVIPEVTVPRTFCTKTVSVTNAKTKKLWKVTCGLWIEEATISDYNDVEGCFFIPNNNKDKLAVYLCKDHFEMFKKELDKNQK